MMHSMELGHESWARSINATGVGHIDKNFGRVNIHFYSWHARIVNMQLNKILIQSDEKSSDEHNGDDNLLVSPPMQ